MDKKYDQIIDKEKQLFLHLLSDYLNNRNSCIIRDNYVWHTIIQYANKHQLSGVIYIQGKDYMPTEYMQLLEKRTFATLYYQSNRENELNRIQTLFSASAIPFFVIKGPIIAQLYSIPKLREMGDIDIVVHTEDREKCHKLLLNNGFECHVKNEMHEWHYYKNNMLYELHDLLVYDESVNEEGQALFFNNCWQYVKDGQLDWNFHLLFLIFHLRKHLMHIGAGFRHFMDLAIVAQKVDIDWRWVEEKLIETKMLRFAQVCYGLIEKWFGIKTPIYKEIQNDFYLEVTNKIFEDGVFGFDNKENYDNEVFNLVRRSKYPRLRMLAVLFRKILPPWRQLKSYEEYAYLKRYPFMLPVVWTHRLIFISKKRKGKGVIKSIKNSFTSKDRLIHHMDIMSKWGL